MYIKSTRRWGGGKNSGIEHCYLKAFLSIAHGWPIGSGSKLQPDMHIFCPLLNNWHFRWRVAQKEDLRFSKHAEDGRRNRTARQPSNGWKGKSIWRTQHQHRLTLHQTSTEIRLGGGGRGEEKKRLARRQISNTAPGSIGQLRAKGVDMLTLTTKPKWSNAAGIISGVWTKTWN